MSQEQPEQPVPPEELKPWYYQYWFLYPVIIFWPLWPVLIIRSPWHNRLVIRAIAWAMIFVGCYLIGSEIEWYRFRLSGLNQFTITILIPGILLTVLTQVLWFRDRKKVRQALREETSPPVSPAPAQSRRTRSRRRGRRSGRSGRGG